MLLEFFLILSLFTLLKLKHIILFTSFIHFLLILPRFLLEIIDGLLLIEHLKVYTLYVLFDYFDLFKTECLIGLVVVAILVEGVNVLELLDFESVIDCMHCLDFLARTLYFFLDVCEVARTLKLLLSHLKLDTLHV